MFTCVCENECNERQAWYTRIAPPFTREYNVKASARDSLDSLVTRQFALETELVVY